MLAVVYQFTEVIRDEAFFPVETTEMKNRSTNVGNKFMPTATPRKLAAVSQRLMHSGSSAQ